MQTIIIETICVLAIVLSLKSVVVLGRQAPWTSAGWWLTIVYLVDESVKIGIGRTLDAPVPYFLLAALTIAFVVAGRRDERQAEPWWWPVRCGSSRAEKRESSAP